MHLAKLEFTNFRSCRATDIWFQPDLTVLVGENNSGKSNVIDGIRLVTAPSDGRRSRYCDSADLSFGAESSSFELRATYGGLSVAEQALYLSASNGVGTGEVSYRLRYDLPGPHERRGRTSWTLGANDAVDPEPAARDRVRHVYLPPLRDAQQALSSGSGDRIEFVLKALAVPGEIETLEDAAAGAFGGLGADPLVIRTNEAVGDQVATLTQGSIPHTTEIGFAEPRLRHLARAMRVKLGEAGVAPTDLAHSGLGYANLLYLSTVVVELEATHDADLTIFLVEEPEAHLHPQLQSAVLDFLIDAAREDPVASGDIQVVITTHSAQLAATVPSAHVEVLKSVVTDASGGAVDRVTRAVPTWCLEVPEPQRRKVDRYINATRSPMLFGPRVMLVEGIAEALLMPTLARRFLNTDEDRARFRGLALVAIDGVDFEPYLRLLLSPHAGLRIAERVIVVTDRDPSAPGDRVDRLTQLAMELGAEHCLTVEAAEITLEAALFAAGNVECLRNGFLAQRPQSQHAWEEVLGESEADRPGQLMKTFKDKGISKGELAQFIAAVVESEQPFTIPAYLLAALQRAVA